LAIETGSYLIN